MTNKDRFATISPTLIQLLNNEVTNWEELIPEDYDTTNLNENSLIQLLKDNQHRKLDSDSTAHYQEEMHKLAIDPSRMFIDAMKSTIEFHSEISNQWYDFETRLNRAFTIFIAKKTKVTSTDQLQKGLEKLSDSLNEKFQKLETEGDAAIHKSFEDYFKIKFSHSSSIFESKKSVIGSQISKFQETNKEDISDSKKFFDETVKTVIEQKINLIKQGELPLDIFSKSDLFTDEEIKNIQDKQKDLYERIIERGKQTNLQVFDAIAYEYLGVKGKDDIMAIINNVSNDLIPEEAKNMLSMALDSGFILPEESKEENRRHKRLAGKVVSCALSNAEAVFSFISARLSVKKGKESEFSFYDNPIYKWCDSWKWWQLYLITSATPFPCLTVMAGATIAEKIKNSKISAGDIAMIFSAAAFLISLLTWKATILGSILFGIGSLFWIIGKVCENLQPKEKQKEELYMCLIVTSIMGFLNSGIGAIRSCLM